MRLSLLALSLSVGLAAIEPQWAWNIAPGAVMMAMFGLIGAAARARFGPGAVSD